MHYSCLYDLPFWHLKYFFFLFSSNVNLVFTSIKKPFKYIKQRFKKYMLNFIPYFQVLILCGVLCVIPAYMSYLLISTVDLDLWTMVVISSSLLTSIQVVGHLIHYMLYLYDSFRSSDPLDSIDDWVYYLKSAVHGLGMVL